MCTFHCQYSYNRDDTLAIHENVAVAVKKRPTFPNNDLSISVLLWDVFETRSFTLPRTLFLYPWWICAVAPERGVYFLHFSLACFRLATLKWICDLLHSSQNARMLLWPFARFVGMTGDLRRLWFVCWARTWKVIRNNLYPESSEYSGRCVFPDHVNQIIVKRATIQKILILNATFLRI